MSTDSLIQKLAKGALKSAVHVCGGVGATFSVLMMGGMESVAVFGLQMPRAAAVGITLAGSSYVADFVIPQITSHLPLATGTLKTLAIEDLALQPLTVGVAVALLSTIAVPGAIEGVASPAHNLVAEMVLGAGAATTAAYLMNGAGVISNVLLY